MKQIFGKWVMAVVLMLMPMIGAYAGSNRTQVNLPQSAGYTLQPGNMYIVRTSMTINATAGNGLNVAAKGSGQAPVLYIPAGVTLTVTGANANGQTGAGAGIYVPSNAELIITGAGKLVATGGNAANGGNGERGYNAGGDDPRYSSRTQDEKVGDGNEWKIYQSGAGGKGGYGGGGAGAGIGGIGGNGGNGGIGGAARFFQETGESSTSQKDGKDGAAGGAGAKGAVMGKVYVMGTVNVTATAGNAGTAGGAGGNQGCTLWNKIDGYNNVAGGGGGGAGGGAGHAAYGIGAGGRGAGGGGGGGSGAVDWSLYRPNTDDNSYGHGGSATSGGGKGNTDGGNGVNNLRPRDTGKAGIISIIFYKEGGTGGAAGVAGAAATTADNGYLYVGPNATVNETTGNTPSDYKGTKETTAPADMMVTITFVNNEFKSDGSEVSGPETLGSESIEIGSTLSAISSPYILSATSKYFAGYYSSDKGAGTRIYKGDGSCAISAMPFSSNQTLYAHFSHNQHNVSWDYTYSYDNSGATAYADVAEGDRVQKAKLTFYFRDGTSESRVLTAASVTRPGGSTPAADNHLTTTGAITLVTSGTENLSGNTITIVLDDSKLSQFIDYKFDALNNDGTTIPTNWLLSTNRDTHTTTISFAGANADKCFNQTWTVTLKGLKVYPDVIFVKPMFAEPDGSTYEIISQLKDNGTIHYDGVQCSKGAETAEQCTYTGSFPVWKYKDATNSYKNKIGLVGFILGGKKYYMDATPGNVHSDMISPDTYNSANNISLYTAGQPILDIKMDVEASVIPVLRLMPGHADATLASGTPSILVNEARDGNYSLNGYKAVRYGYNQIGWSATEGSTTAEYAMDASLAGITGALTLYAVWNGATPPVFHPQSFTYADDKATLNLIVTDDSQVNKLYKYITSEDKGDNPSSFDPSVWTEVSITPAASVTVNIETTTLPHAYFYFKAVDNEGAVAYAASGEQKTDGISPKIEADHSGIVCATAVTFTLTDNNNVKKIEVKQGTGSWTTVSATTTSSDKSKTYTIAVPADASAEGKYSIRVTDAADNVTTLEDAVTVYKEHNFTTTHEAKMPTATEAGYKKKITVCSHNCGYVKVEGETDPKPIEDYYLPAGSVLTMVDNNDVSTTLAATETVNEALTGIKEDASLATAKFVVITANTDVDSEKTNKSFVDPDREIYLDLNGNSLRWYKDDNGTPDNTADDVDKFTTFTGNENVTIYLKDDGFLQYGNYSKVTNTPIFYARNLMPPYFDAGIRSGCWQALFLPFDCDASWYIDFGTLQYVQIGTGTDDTKLVISRGVDKLYHYYPHFVRTANGTVNFKVKDPTTGGALTTLYAKETPTEISVSDKDGNTGTYTMKGSLDENDNVATSDRAYWVLTNGGIFTWAKATSVEDATKSHQRPYHWVVYDKGSHSGAKPARALSMVFVDANSTGIDEVKTAVESDAIYDINGRKMQNTDALAPGIYISNGKKFVIR